MRRVGFVMASVLLVGAAFADYIYEKWRDRWDQLNMTEKAVVRNMKTCETGTWTLKEKAVTELGLRDKEQLARVRPPLYEDMVKVMRAMLVFDRWRVRRAAAEAVANIGCTQALDLLKKMMFEDKKREVRAEAALAVARLSKKGDKQIVKMLCKALLEDGWSIVRASAAKGLRLVGDESAFEALCKAAESDAYSTVREQALRTLFALGCRTERFCEIVTGRLSDAYSRVRSAACEIAGEIGLEAAADKVAQLLNDKKYRVRIAAAKALTKIAAPKHVGTVSNALKNSDVGEFRARLIEVLGKIATEDAKKVVAEAINDKDKFVRMAAMLTLCRLGDDRGINALKELLKRSKSLYFFQMLHRIKTEKVKHPKVIGMLESLTREMKEGDWRRSDLERVIKELKGGK
ncbi:MAG: hypothetical protein DRP63_01655 [Planctomycetota bacterium]|mgnify:CR=1 FL=1|nr:MAG: hypothetical protein DRP63_01655 [Planctomycetota bacterium]